MSDGATHGKKNLLRGARVTQIDKKARHVRNKKIVERGEGGGGFVANALWNGGRKHFAKSGPHAWPCSGFFSHRCRCLQQLRKIYIFNLKATSLCTKTLKRDGSAYMLH